MRGISGVGATTQYQKMYPVSQILKAAIDGIEFQQLSFISYYTIVRCELSYATNSKKMLGIINKIAIITTID